MIIWATLIMQWLILGIVSAGLWQSIRARKIQSQVLESIRANRNEMVWMLSRIEFLENYNREGRYAGADQQEGV